MILYQKGELPPVEGVMLHRLCHLFLGFSLNPPMFQYPLGALGARSGCAFPSVIGSHLDCVLDAELVMYLRGQTKGVFSSSPWTLCCWGKQSSLSSIAPTLLVTPIHPFCCIPYFPLTPRSTIALHHSIGNLMIIYHNLKCFLMSLSPE